ncbi:MAG TPA: hypothetical protein VGM91_15665 [Conexibacter sp.]|jgi:hypothetical protein
MPKPIVIVAALAAVAAFAGCGQAEDRDQVGDVAARFSAALADGDGAAACAQLTEAAVQALEQQARAPCARAVTELGASPGKLARVRVYETSAEALYTKGTTAFLDRSADGWRLSAVGCRLDEGKPRSRPATCALEA